MSDLPDRISTGELRDKADQMSGEMGRQHAANLPRYRSHKEVQAVKIGAINYDIDLARAENRDTDGSAVIVPVEPGTPPIRVDAKYVRKHEPKVGGYYVRYRDGYESWSPASEFEDGYTRIT